MAHCQILLPYMLNLTVLHMCFMGELHNFIHHEFQFYQVYIIWIARTW